MKNYMIIKHRVRDLDQFQTAFDQLKPMRERYGLKDIGQYRSADEPETVIVLLEVADISGAHAYWHSKVLSEGRKEAGIVGPLTAGTDQVWLHRSQQFRRGLLNVCLGSLADSRRLDLKFPLFLPKRTLSTPIRLHHHTI